MNVLVACEESQAVTIELRKLGHKAFSCDIKNCSGGHPEWHIIGNALELINGRCIFQTMDGSWHEIKGKWDLLIAFPPCTYLSNAGATQLRKGTQINEERLAQAKKARTFFMTFYNADCPRIAIENPVPGRIHSLPEYSQIIQPYMFGDPWKKRTCLWLINLPILMATEICIPEGNWVSTSEIVKAGDNLKGHRSPTLRSKTFPGIARAMAAQWTEFETAGNIAG